MNSKRTIMILILVLTIGIVGLTIAYFSNSSTVNNIFTTQPYGTPVTETFTSPSNWLPCTTTEKTVVATNSGNVDEAVRISLSESWVTANGDTLNGWITENANKAKMIGKINVDFYEPYPKNPKIAKVFKEIGLVDELGSGVRNITKYTKIYSGGVPEFKEDDIFRTIVPLNCNEEKKAQDKVEKAQDKVEKAQDKVEKAQDNIKNIIIDFVKMRRISLK